jgi:hypothetical protein
MNNQGMQNTSIIFVLLHFQYLTVIENVGDCPRPASPLVPGLTFSMCHRNSE